MLFSVYCLLLLVVFYFVMFLERISNENDETKNGVVSMVVVVSHWMKSCVLPSKSDYLTPRHFEIEKFN